MKNENLIVEMRNVSRRFGKTQALDRIDLEISRGKIIGLLGANGAGKSTLLRHIIGLYLADQGQCITFKTDATKLSSKELGRIGYVHQEGELLPEVIVVGYPVRCEPVTKSPREPSSLPGAEGCEGR